MLPQTDENPLPEKIYISELAKLVGRSAHTVRQWERDKVLPYALMSFRADNGYRFWKPDQVEGIRNWLVKTDRKAGKGLKFYQQEKENV